MTSDLKSFADRLREAISRASGMGGPPENSTAAFPDAEFNVLALELFALQFNSNAPYRRICESRGLKPGKVGHWSAIPAVPTAAFKELELTCLPPDQRTTVFHSSGTTGQRPSRHWHSAASLALYEASLWPWFERHVLGVVGQAFQPAGAGDFPVARSAHQTGKSGEPADRNVCPTSAGNWDLAILTPPPEAAPNSSLVHMFESVRRRVGAGAAQFLGGLAAEGAWTLDAVRVEAVLRAAVESERPMVMLGTAFNFVHLLDDLAARNVCLTLPPGSRVMETGGYKGRSRELAKPELHALITKHLGVPRSHIVCEYGMSELSSQAYDGVAGAEYQSPEPGTRRFSFPPWTRVQIISPETGREMAEGETGLVRIFDLANVFSVLAVQTEDLAIRCGIGFELIGRAAAAEPRGCSLMATDARKSQIP
jgi:hypothetical protein